MAQSGKPLFGIDSTNHEKVVIFGGDVPLKMGDAVVGALGASGGTVDQDLEVGSGGGRRVPGEALTVEVDRRGATNTLLRLCAVPG